MSGRNYGTMNQGYYYDQGKKVGYDITVGRLHFSHVAHHSKTQLKEQLVNSGYSVNDIVEQRVEELN